MLPASEVSFTEAQSLIWGRYLLNRNFTKPSNVWVRPEMAVPTAANMVWITPRMALRKDCKTAATEPSAAVMVCKMEEMREPSWSTREGIFVAV